MRAAILGENPAVGLSVTSQRRATTRVLITTPTCRVFLQYIGRTGAVPFRGYEGGRVRAYSFREERPATCAQMPHQAVTSKLPCHTGYSTQGLEATYRRSYAAGRLRVRHLGRGRVWSRETMKRCCGLSSGWHEYLGSNTGKGLKIRHPLRCGGYCVAWNRNRDYGNSCRSFLK